MSDSYFQGKFCIVDLREVICAGSVKLPPHLGLDVIFKSGATATLPHDDYESFLTAYRAWIKRQEHFSGDSESKVK